MAPGRSTESRGNRPGDGESEARKRRRGRSQHLPIDRESVFAYDGRHRENFQTEVGGERMNGMGAGWKPLLLIVLAAWGLYAASHAPVPLAQNRIDHIGPERAAGGGLIVMEQPHPIRIMTFNIRHGRGLDGKVNLERIAREIADSRADLVALQEADRFHVRSGFRDQVRVLADRLDMNWAFAPSVRMGITLYGNAVLARFPILREETFLLPGVKERRALQKVVVLVGDEEMTVYNTHLGVLPEERSEQLRIIAELLRETDGPAVLLGDFNMEDGHPLMSLLGPEWKKLKMETKSPTIVSGHEIDHVFVNRTAHLPKVWTIPTDASDHNPVVAEFAWSREDRVMLALAE